MDGEEWFQHPQYIAPEKISISEAEGISALRFAWKNIYGDFPSDDSLGILFAQVALETGRFKVGFHNYNFGNLKANLSYINLGGEHYFTMFECGEILNGKEVIFKPPHMQTRFRAYKTLIEGAEDYIKFLSQRERYKTAWAQLLKGNPTKYSHELKIHGYYTANEAKYTAGVVRLFEEFHRRKEELLIWEPVKEPEENQIEEDPEDIVLEDRETTTLPPSSEESKKEIVIPPLLKPPVINIIEEDDPYPEKNNKAKGVISIMLLCLVGYVVTVFQGCETFITDLFN